MCREVPHEARIAIEEAEFGEIAEGENDEGTGTLIAISVLNDGGRRGWMAAEAGDFAVDEETVPKTLPKVPHKAGIAVEETELEEVADVEIGEGAEVGREATFKLSGKTGQTCFPTILFISQFALLDELGWGVRYKQSCLKGLSQKTVSYTSALDICAVLRATFP